MRYSNLWLSKFKKFISWSIFGELQLTKIFNFQTSCWNLKIRRMWAKLYVAFLFIYLFIYLFIFTFYFWKNFDVLNWKIPCFLLKIKFNKNETELKMENPNHSFSGIKHVLQVVYKLRIKRKTVISWSSRNKKYYIFCNNNFAQKKFI